MKKKKSTDVVIPRLGPPENLRPGGAHKDKAARTRAETRRRAIEAASV
jgi:hypothetical protein